jgi:hypothetical protein
LKFLFLTWLDVPGFPFFDGTFWYHPTWCCIVAHVTVRVQKE